MKIEGYNSFLKHCPKCGTPGCLKIIECIEKPTYLFCSFCEEWICKLEILEINFNPNNIARSWIQENDEFNAFVSIKKYRGEDTKDLNKCWAEFREEERKIIGKQNGQPKNHPN